jgi:NusA-like KH domain protein
MNRIKLDSHHLKVISLFEGLTNVSCKDCVREADRIVFVVPENQASKAVGKKGVNVHRLEKALKRKLKIIEYNPEVIEFTKNVIYPLKAKEVSEQDGQIVITPADLQTRGHLIGRNAKQLRATESIIKRHFPINEVRVI